MNNNTNDMTTKEEIKELKISGSWYLYRLKKFKFYFHKWYKIHKINHGDTRFVQQAGWHFVLAAHDLSYMDYIRAPIKIFGKKDVMEIGQVALKPFDRLIVGQKIVIVYDLDDRRFRLYHKSLYVPGVIVPYNQYIADLEHAIEKDRNFIVNVRDNKNIAYEVRVMSDHCTKCHRIIQMGRSQKGIVAMHSLVNLICTIHSIEEEYYKDDNVEGGNSNAGF